MPFGMKWSNEIMKTTRKACERHSVQYIRGDEAEDRDIIRSIWQEIAKATHIVVDLTDFNANVALELGLVHTIGKPSLLIGQGNTVRKLFPMISKQRFHKYEDKKDLKALLHNFLE